MSEGRLKFHRATQVLQGLASVCLLVLSVHFLWITINEAQEAFHDPEETKEPRRRAEPTPQDPDELLKTLSEESQKLPQLGEDRNSQGSDPSAAQKAAPKRRQIFVDFGPSRSEVYLDGRRVGKTPFVGQITCRDGDQIRIEVVPPQGMPIRRTGTCRGRSLRARGTIEQGERSKVEQRQ